MMAFYEKQAPTELVIDGTTVSLGAILVPEKQGVKRTVAFASRSLSDDELGTRIASDAEPISQLWPMV